MAITMFDIMEGVNNEATHAKYSPSQLERILICPGSVRMSENIESVASKYAEEGTMLHAVMSYVVTHKLFSLEGIEWQRLEHEALIGKCIEKLLIIIKDLTGIKIYTDLKVKMPNCDVLGTLDIALTGRDRLTGRFEVHVIDYKFGGGIRVYVDDNPQGLAYISGFRAGLKNLPKNVDYFFWIFQPRFDYFEPKMYTAGELSKFEELVREVVKIAEKEDAPIVPSADSCRWCTAYGRCNRSVENAKQYYEENNTRAFDDFNLI